MTDWLECDDTPEPTPTVTIDPSWRRADGDRYELVVRGEVFGDFIDPARFPPESIDWVDTDGAAEALVRPCSWCAARNTGGLFALPA